MHLKHGAALQGGKYRIEKLLGQGGFGITYLAVQTGLNRKVAIKEFFMKEHCNRDADTSRVSVPSVGSRELVAKFKDKFIREAQMIYDLKHQNIILIRDFFEENGTAYYVMEYHDGGSLGSLPLPLTAEEASVYIRQVASALSYLHDRNTMHLDVKPSNVLIDKEGNAVLIDFGISKHYDYAGHQTSSTPVGISKGYAPIEQYSQSTLEFNPATDIYSLGATLYKLLTGNTPTEASLLVSNPKLLIFPSSVSEPMAALIRRCMSPSLDARPQSISEFLGMLDDALAASTGDETKVDSEDDATTVIFGNDKVDVDLGDKTRTPSEKKKSRRWLWWLLAAVILVVAGVVALMSSRSGGESTEHSGREHVLEQAKLEAEKAKAEQKMKQSASEASYSNGVLRVKGVEYPMVYVAGGEFSMGSNSVYSNEQPVHTVSLDGYSIGKYEVTQELWEAVMGSNPSYCKGPRKPVENVSWNDCDEFIRKLNSMTGQNFRLPTEAEWEYAARGGRNQDPYMYSGSDTVGAVAWYYGNSGSQTHEVGGKSPNSLGIYDMSGNVYEWCYDAYSSDYYSKSPTNNPKNEGSAGSFRVLRGGSWNFNAFHCQVSYRAEGAPDFRISRNGFRLYL